MSAIAAPAASGETRHGTELTLVLFAVVLTLVCFTSVSAAYTDALPSGLLEDGIGFAARFHIHPDVRVSPSQGGGILLKLPNGEGWRFRAGGAQITVEESVYLGTDMVRKSEQLVLTGVVANQPAEVGWVFEQINIA